MAVNDFESDVAFIDTDEAPRKRIVNCLGKVFKATRIGIASCGPESYTRCYKIGGRIKQYHNGGISFLGNLERTKRLSSIEK